MENCFSIYEKQNISKQDYIYYERNLVDKEGNIFDYILVADGHGNDTIINIIRNISWSQVLQNHHTIQEFINRNIPYDEKTLKSGSTLSIVKITEKGFHNFWIGDSKIMIWNNASNSNIFESIFESKNHDKNNSEEIIRIQEKRCCKQIIENISQPHIIEVPSKETNNNIGSISMMKTAIIFEFMNGTRLNMTRSLGHENITGNNLDYSFISRYNPSIQYQIIIGSDGLWDMLTDHDSIYLLPFIKNAKQLGDIILHRWYHKWRILDTNKKKIIGTNSFPKHNIDDIVIGVCHSKIDTVNSLG